MLSDLSDKVDLSVESSGGSSEPKTCYVLFPPIIDEARLQNILPRALWYLFGELDHGADLIVPTDLDRPVDLSLPVHLDQSIAGLWPRVGDRVVWTGSDVSALADRLRDRERVVFLSHDDTHRKEVVALAKAHPNATVTHVDPEVAQYESSLYLKLTSSDGRGTADDIAACRGRFETMVSQLDTTRVFLFGTGPSIDTVDFATLPAGEKIVTNSMVANSELMEIVRPKVIVASDPIFHAGCSSYAEAFRTKLLAAMRDYGSFFVFPMRDYGVYKAHIPEDLQDRLVGIPIVSSKNLNHELSRAFHVSSTQNVMTLFLLPLAASISKNIVLAGFDGRPISSSDYFWSHSKAVQFNDQMDMIQAAHPAFFKISYNDYLFRHMHTVAQYLNEGETAGIRFTSLTDSFIPAIKGRYVAGSAEEVLDLSSPRPAVSIVMPCYNAAGTLDETVASIFDQSFSDWELVCVDDGSTDGTLAKLHQLRDIDQRIRVVSQANGGVSAARNTGLELARGAYICFLDADDLFYPTALEDRYAFCQEEGKGQVVYGELTMIDDKGNDLNVSAGRGGTVTFDEFDRWPGATQTAMAAAHIFKAARFEVGLAYCEDWLYFAQVARAGAPLVNCGKKIARYRWHGDAATQRDFAKHLMQTSHVFRILTSDDWENGMLHSDYAIGLPMGPFHQIELKRMYSLFLQCVFRKDFAAAEHIFGFIDRKSRRAPLAKLVVDDVERAAVRTLFKPFNSYELYTFVAEGAKAYAAFVKPLAKGEKHKVFSHAFTSFLTRAQKAAYSGIIEAPSSADDAASSAIANLQEASTASMMEDAGLLPTKHRRVRTLYLSVKKIPLMDRLLRPMKRRYLERNQLG